MSELRTAEIAPGIYWVGGSSQDGGLHCNPYLLVDGEEAVLIDPGSVLDFADVYANVCSIVPLEKIKYVILHHQDPDFCASVPLFEAQGTKFTIATHWRTQTLVKYYGIKSDYYIVNEHDFRLKLASGRILSFIQTPYLHFPGAIATYDNTSKTLFSSDLFGAFSHQWSLYADDNYSERMKTFHEHYMPSNEILRPVMEVLLGLDIARIAPQHGSVIKHKITEHIKTLRDLECGFMLEPLKKDLAKSGGYRSIISEIVRRYGLIFSKDEVRGIIKELEISFEEDSLEIIDYNYRGIVLWNLFFEKVLAQKGLSWLLVIEPFVQKLAKEYDLSLPEVFQTSLKKAEEEARSLNEENIKLKEINAKLSISIREVQEKLSRCPITGLYNYEFFKQYLNTEIQGISQQNLVQNPALVILSVDQTEKITFTYGDSELEQILKNIVYLLNSIKEDNTVIFRLEGATFACYLPHTTKNKAVAIAEIIRNAIANSEKFIESITVSIGVVSLEEILGNEPILISWAETMYNTAVMRVRMAKNMGMNLVCSVSEIANYQEESGKILIVDTDQVNIDILKTFLKNLKYQVFIALDGEEALQITEREHIDLIISDVMLPKIDGFLLREKLLRHSQTKKIPFIIVSFLKNEESIKRAAALEIEHYFKKPFMLSELLGVIVNKFKEETRQ